jgi:hypothetical protein
MGRLALTEKELSRAFDAPGRGRLRNGPHGAILRLQHAAGNRAVSRLLQRQATGGGTAVATPRIVSVESNGGNEVLVRLDDGSRYRITRIRRPIVTTTREPLPPNVRLGSDDDRVWVELEWCRGTRGEIRIGGNPQGAARALLRDMAQEIANGGGADAVARAARNAEITPFADFDIAQSGSWRLTGGVTVNVGAGGVTGGGGRIGVRRGPFDFELEGSHDDGDTRVTGNVRVTPGRRDEEFTCPTRERVYIRQQTEYLAQLERDVPGHVEQRTRPVSRTRQEQRYVYFRYARADIDTQRSAHELDLLRSNLDGGFRVSGIEAFTSPEGSLERGPGFEGNRTLADGRARAASELVRRLGGDVGTVVATGRDELYGGGEQELKGRALETEAVEQFEGQEAEARHRTPEVREQLERARTERERAALVYPWLRRAVITLTRTVTEQESYEERVPARVHIEPRTAPAEVLEAAKAAFRRDDALRR